MLTGLYPFNGENDSELFKNICKCQLKCPDVFDEELTHLLKNILVLNPSHRLKAAEILAHPWLRKH
jgi:serine/threonine protein kinase